MFSLSESFLLSCLVQSFFLILYLLHPARITNRRTQLLVILLLSLNFGHFETLLFSTRYVRSHPEWAYIGTLFFLFYPSAFLLYTQSLIDRKFIFEWAHLKHVLFPGAIGLLFFVEYYLLPHDQKIYFLKEGNWFSMIGSPFLAIIIHLVILSYLFIVLRNLKRFGITLKHFFSNIEDKQHTWLRYLTIGFVFTWCGSLFFCLVAHVFMDGDIEHLTIQFRGITGVLFTNYIMIFSLKQPEIISEVAIDLEKHTKSEEDKHQVEEPVFLNNLHTFMLSEKPYLNPNLSLDLLAKALNVKPRFLSERLNRDAKANFYEFVSHFRIEEAKERLQRAPSSQSILDIMLGVGFNSKSVFNSAFKKATGLTPRQFRLSNSSKPK